MPTTEATKPGHLRSVPLSLADPQTDEATFLALLDIRTKRGGMRGALRCWLGASIDVAATGLVARWAERNGRDSRRGGETPPP